MRVYACTVFCSYLTFYVKEGKDRRDDLENKFKHRTGKIWRIQERHLEAEETGRSLEIVTTRTNPWPLKNKNKIRWAPGQNSILVMLRSKPRRNAIPKGNKLPHYELALPEAGPPDPTRSEALSSSGNAPSHLEKSPKPGGTLWSGGSVPAAPAKCWTWPKMLRGNDQHGKPWEWMHKEMPDGELRCPIVGKQILSWFF